MGFCWQIENIWNITSLTLIYSGCSSASWIWSVFHRLSVNTVNSLQYHAFNFVTVFVFMCFICFLRAFLNVHRHENSSGYYRTSVYFLSKIFADLIPNRINPIIVFSAIAYYMMGNTHTYRHIHTKGESSKLCRKQPIILSAHAWLHPKGVQVLRNKICLPHFAPIVDHFLSGTFHLTSLRCLTAPGRTSEKQHSG